MGITHRFAVLTNFVVLATACHKSEGERPVEAAPAAASNPPSRTAASARESISDARCTREEGCGNIGESKKYSSREDCLSRIRADWKDDLNARECPNGVNQSELDECLKAIRTEDCGNPFDTLNRLAACTKNQICNG
jgi:hypothetical protein